VNVVTGARQCGCAVVDGLWAVKLFSTISGDEYTGVYSCSVRAWIFGVVPWIRKREGDKLFRSRLKY